MQTRQPEPALMHRTAARLGRLTTLVALVALLGACSGAEHGDLQTWVEQVQQQQKGRVPPLPDVKPFETFTYQAYALRDPFTTFIETESEPVADLPGGGLRPDFNRKRETLEQFPLDSLKYVGNLEKNGVRWGLVQSGSPDDTVYKVQVGNHVGQNYGEIVGITETEVKLVELIPDGRGGWNERDAAMALNE